jgi:hypothetical protein
MPPETKPSPLESAVNNTVVARTANAAHGGAAQAVHDGAKERVQELSDRTVVGAVASKAAPILDKAIIASAEFFKDSRAKSLEEQSMQEQKSGTFIDALKGSIHRVEAEGLLLGDAGGVLFRSGPNPVTVAANLPTKPEAVRYSNGAEHVNGHGAPLETPGSKPAAKNIKTPQQ